MNAIPTAGNASSALHSARAGIQRALTGLSHDAIQIARSATLEEGPDNVVSALVDAHQQRLFAQANARVMTAADEMLGTLLDVRA